MDSVSAKALETGEIQLYSPQHLHGVAAAGVAAGVAAVAAWWSDCRTSVHGHGRTDLDMIDWCREAEGSRKMGGSQPDLVSIPDPARSSKFINTRNTRSYLCGWLEWRYL